MAAHRKNFSEALTKAKDAGKQERLLCKHREASGQIETINLDLTYAVCFNLATMYHSALASLPAHDNNRHSLNASPPHSLNAGHGMFNEALDTYSLIVQNKQCVAPTAPGSDGGDFRSTSLDAARRRSTSLPAPPRPSLTYTPP